MNYDILFRKLKKNGILKSDVAKKLGYSGGHLSKIISGQQEASTDFLIAFKKEYGKFIGDDLKNILTDTGIEITKPTVTTNEELTQTAIVKVLFQEVAKMKSKIYGLPFEDCLKELEQNTILVMKDLLKGTKT